ncbi:MAG: hypothetical protein H0W61_01675 [Bacteroidetes bacterium]|nr:hypothetical protein [Bacteroidota bacterium]
MNLKLLLFIHALVTFAAGIVLVITPSFIPSSVNIHINSAEYLLCYFLAAAEFAMAYLSFRSRKISDTAALRVISISFIVFHASTLILELFALSQGLSVKIISNVIVRIFIVILFYFYGVAPFKQNSKNNA